MNLHVETEQENDGRWIAEVPEIPGAMSYGPTQVEAVAKAKALALRVLADRLEHGEAVPEMSNVFPSRHEPMAEHQGAPGLGCAVARRLENQTRARRLASHLGTRRLG